MRPLKLGYLDEAETALREAMEVAPERADAYFKLGLVYQRKRDLATASVTCEEGLALEDDPAGRIFLANVQDALGQPARARINFEKAIAAEPENEES
jgi:tetratricopeptide (TPR) repeat protein